MSRTRRHQSADHLCVVDPLQPKLGELDRQWIVRFYSDHCWRYSPPRWFIRHYKRAINTRNEHMLRRWLADPGFDPVFDVKHYYRATFDWN